MKSTLLGFILLSLFTIQSQAYPLIPNKEWAQGHLCDRSNSDYAGDRYQEKIPYCNRNVDHELKSKLYDMYGIPEKCRDRYTIDHIIPLSIGGDNSAQNLWPEHKLVKQTRPQFEEEIFGEVSQGQMKQKDAIDLVLKEKFTPKKPTIGKTDCDR